MHSFGPQTLHPFLWRLVMIKLWTLNAVMILKTVPHNPRFMTVSHIWLVHLGFLESGSNGRSLIRIAPEGGTSSMVDGGSNVCITGDL
jgi:hypothetical protein